MPDGTKETSLQQELPSSDIITSSHHVASSANMADSLCARTTRQKVPSKAVDQDEVRIERATDMKARKAGHLGDVRKRLNFVHSLLSEGAGVEEVIQNVECYERAFRKFVDAHETYLRLEVNGRNDKRGQRKLRIGKGEQISPRCRAKYVEIKDEKCYESNVEIGSEVASVE